MTCRCLPFFLLPDVVRHARLTCNEYVCCLFAKSTSNLLHLRASGRPTKYLEGRLFSMRVSVLSLVIFAGAGLLLLKCMGMPQRAEMCLDSSQLSYRERFNIPYSETILFCPRGVFFFFCVTRYKHASSRDTPLLETGLSVWTKDTPFRCLIEYLVHMIE